MKQIVRFEGEDGSFMWVEVDVPQESDVGLVVDAGGEPSKALTRLEDSLASVQGAATALMSTVTRMTESARPDEATLELALSLAVEGGVVVARDRRRPRRR